MAGDADLVVQLVQMPMTAVDVDPRDLAYESHDRRMHRICGEQRGRGVEETWTRHHRAHLRPAGGERGSERHVCGRLLVTRMNHSEPPASFVEGVEQRIALQAGKGKIVSILCRTRASTIASAVVIGGKYRTFVSGVPPTAEIATYVEADCMTS